MRVDWVPVSASALVAGVTALALGAILLPTGNGGSSESLRLVEQNDGRWIAVSGLFFLASVAMTLGLPSILTLFDRRGSRLGMTALVVFAIGCIGTAGYAMLLAFFRALVLQNAIRDEAFTAVSKDAGLTAFLYGWVAAFYLGELLLALALLRAATTPRWVPWLLLLHVALLPMSGILPQPIRSGSVLVMAVGFAGIAITANNTDIELSLQR
jgi:hypothetical protein